MALADSTRFGPAPGAAPAPLGAGSTIRATTPTWSRLLDRVIDGFLVVWLFSAANAIIPVLLTGDGPLMADNKALLRVVYVLPPTVTAPFLVLSRLKAVTALLLRNLALLLLLLWVWCSVLWSFAPDITMGRALSLTMFTLLACYLVVRHDHDWILTRLAWVSLILLAASVAFIVSLPSLSAMPDARGLRAIFPHTNSYG